MRTRESPQRRVHPNCDALFRLALSVALMIWIAVATSASRALATNGTWTDTTSGGLWSATTDWFGFTIATGTDGIADFSTLNITSDETVHLDSSRTIGQLKFGDTTPSNNWILDNNGLGTNVLTLAVSSGSPTITVNNDTATVNLVLAGTQGFTKSGAGVLLLNDADTFTGSLAVNAGTLALGNAGALGSTDQRRQRFQRRHARSRRPDDRRKHLGHLRNRRGGQRRPDSTAARPPPIFPERSPSAPQRPSAAAAISRSAGASTAPFNTLTKIGNNTLTLSGSTDNNNLGVTVNSGTVILAKASGGAPTNVHAVGSSGLIVNGGIAQLAGTGGDQIIDGAAVTVTSGTFDTNGQQRRLRDAQSPRNRHRECRCAGQLGRSLLGYHAHGRNHPHRQHHDRRDPEYRRA